MQTPKVSVIIITYNRAQLLKTAMQTVLAQTFEDFELLIIDDGSPDDTENTVKSFHDPRVRYVKHAQNQGEGGARNTGIQHAEGEYIAFLDDDDEWLPNKLQLQVRLLDAQPKQVGFVHSALINFYADTGEEVEKKRSVEAVSGQVFDRLLQENFVILSTVMARKACFDAVGPFDLSIPAGLDYDMWVRLSQRYAFAYIDVPLIKYRIHRHNLGSNFSLQIRGQEAFFNKYAAYTKAPGKPNSMRYFKLGLLYGFTQDLKSARRIYLKSIRLCPLNPKPYVAFLLTFLGQRGYQKMLERIVN
jgi:glycosyltransferase involved in cell wall biosynthesis